MSSDALDVCRQLAQSQGGVISRRQAISRGTSSDVLDRLLRSGHWQKLHRGVYFTSDGKPGRETLMWAALSRAGVDASLSHETAAELFGFADGHSSLIHVCVPENRRISAISGAVVHISSRIVEATHPSLLPPRTRVEETVLDLVGQAPVFDAALGVVCSVCQQGLTTVPRIVAAMGRRAKLRWRAELGRALRDIGSGVHSVLEYRYVHKVERPHGLPTAVRQARVAAGGRSRYLDNLYEDYALCVELDGLAAHPDEQRWQDLQRVNAITETGRAVLRYGWTDIDRQSCDTALQVGSVLQHNGWPGTPIPCAPNCAVATRRAA